MPGTRRKINYPKQVLPLPSLHSIFGNMREMPRWDQSSRLCSDFRHFLQSILDGQQDHLPRARHLTLIFGPKSMDQSGLSLGSGKGAGSLHTGTKPTPWSRRYGRVTAGHLSKFDQKSGTMVEICYPLWNSPAHRYRIHTVPSTVCVNFSDAGSPRGC